MKTQFLIHYHYAAGTGRAFADLDRGGDLPRREDIEHWEKLLSEQNPELAPICIVSFQRIDTAPPAKKCENYGHGGRWCGADDCWLKDA